MHIALKVMLAVAAVPVVIVAALLLARLRASAGVNHVEVVIAAAPAAVWRHMIDPALTKAWVGGLVEIEGLTHDGLVVGARDRLVVEMDGRKSTMFSEVTAVEPERRIDQRLRSSEDAVSFVEEISFTMHPEGAGTRFVVHATSVYAFPMSLFEPLITPMAQRKLTDDLARLRANVERG